MLSLQNRIARGLGLLLSTVGLLPTFLFAGEQQTFTVTAPGADTVTIRIPAGLQVVRPQSVPDLPPTVKVTNPSNSFSLQLTFLADPDGRLATPASVDL